MKKQKWEKHKGFFEYWTATQVYPGFSKYLNCEMGAASGEGLASHAHTALPCLPTEHSSMTYVGHRQEDASSLQGCLEISEA